MLTQDQILILLDVVSEAITTNDKKFEHINDERYKEYITKRNEKLEEIRAVLYKMGG